MAYDKVVDSASLDSKLTQVADAIRTKGNTSADLQFPSGFISAIQAIQTGTELQIIVTVTSGATVTATKGSKVVSGISVNGTCTLTVPEAGTWSVTATLNGETSDTKSVTFTDSYALTFYFVSAVLNDNDWATIKAVSDKGEGANYWSIGDRKEITLNGTVGHLALSNYTTYAFIIGFNHNQELEGTNRIHFQLAKTALSGGTDVALCDSSYLSKVSGSGFFAMNSTATNYGGWETADMRFGICGTSLSSAAGTIIAAIPEALRATLKSVTKYTDNAAFGSGSSESNITATTDYFFLPSEYEVFGSITYANSNEASKQAQYAYYSAGNSKIRNKHDEPNAAANWWLRSPCANETADFVFVGTTGVSNFVAASYSIGFAPGFCV